VVLGICRFHRNSNGWNDIGYNLLIDRFGTIYEGRAGGVDRPVIGAHAQGFNGQTAGIALVGNFQTATPPAATLDSLQAVIKWKLALAGITRQERVAMISTGGRLSRFKWGRTVFARPVSGHRDLGFTECPGTSLYGRLPGLAGYLSPSTRVGVRMSMRLSREAAANGGQTVLVSGRIRTGGRALSGELVDVQSFTSQGWVKVGEARSNENGVWQTTVTPATQVFVRGMFGGNDTLRAGRSPWLETPKLKKAPGATN